MAQIQQVTIGQFPKTLFAFCLRASVNWLDPVHPELQNQKKYTKEVYKTFTFIGLFKPPIHLALIDTLQLFTAQSPSLLI